jgi:hypothetical protein
MASPGYQRSQLQSVAEEKLLDAVLLAANGRFANAYYLAGYAVEVALKACIAREFRSETFPHPDFVKGIYTHKFGELVNRAGLRDALDTSKKADPVFGANWATVSEWSESTRYEAVDRETCMLMIDAVKDEPSGVLTWLRRHW